VRVVSAVRRDCLAPPHAPPANYLLQHAAGSGKSLTIAALAAALLQTVSEQLLSGSATQQAWGEGGVGVPKGTGSGPRRPTACNSRLP
jgi:hypothetical protein